jgi:hypothetical protein
VSHERQNQIPVALEADESTVEEMVDTRGQEKFVFGAQPFFIVNESAPASQWLATR